MIHNILFTSEIEVYGAIQVITMPALVIIFGGFLA